MPNAGRIPHVRQFVQPYRAETSYLLLFGIFVGAIVPKCIGLSAQGFWIDEINIIHYIAYPSLDSSFLAAIRKEAHPPLYLLMMWFYGHAFGTGLIALRLSSVIAAIAGVLLCYPLVARTYGRPVALMTTALFGMSCTALYEAQNARPYSLIMTVSLLSTLLFATAVRETWQSNAPRPRTFLLLCGTNLCLSLLHYCGVIFIAAQAIVFFALFVQSAPLRAVLYAFLLGVPALPACAWLVWLLGAFRPAPVPAAFPHMRLTDIASPIRAFFGQPTLAILAIIPLLTIRSWRHLAAGFQTGLEHARSRFRLLRNRNGRMSDASVRVDDLWPLLGLVLLQYLLVLAAATIHSAWMQNKNLYPVFPAGYIAFAIILSRTRMLRTQVGPMLVTTVAAITLVSYLATGYPLQNVSFYSPYREQIREAARFIIDTAKPKDTVMFGDVDMSVDGDASSFLLQPTRIYTDLLKSAGHQLEATDMRTLPPAASAARRGALEQAVTQHDPEGSIIIDLPHGTQLSSEERAYLASVSRCTTDRRFIRQEVMIVNFLQDRCTGLLPDSGTR
jgi:hypothetical protein